MFIKCTRCGEEYRIDEEYKPDVILVSPHKYKSNMELFVVVRTGVYDRGIVGIYNTADLAYQGFIEAKNFEKDEYHVFEVRKYELNKTIDFNNYVKPHELHTNYGPPYYTNDNNYALIKEDK